MNVTPGNKLGYDIQTAEIDDNAITTAKILDANVTLAKLAADAKSGFGLVDSNLNLSTSSQSEVELDSVTLPAGTFATGDIIMIRCICGGNATGNTGGHITVNDGTNTYSSPTNYLNLTLGNANYTEAKFLITEVPNDTSKICGTIVNQRTDGQHIGLATAPGTMVATWITQELTIALRGLADTAGTAYYKWYIFRLKGVA